MSTSHQAACGKEWLDNISNAVVHAPRVATEMGFVIDNAFLMNLSFRPDLHLVFFSDHLRCQLDFGGGHVTTRGH